MEKKHEVEYRALVERKLFNQLCERGRREFRTSFRGPITIEDTYFCPKTTASFDEIEMDKIGSYNLRLRLETENGASKTTLTAKILTKDKDHSSGLEHETAISSFDECRGILDLIGFKPFFTLKKDRYTYQDNEVLVCLEDIKDFQSVIEVEMITTEEKIARARKKLLVLLDHYNIPRTSIVEKSVTNILMRERATFS